METGKFIYILMTTFVCVLSFSGLVAMLGRNDFDIVPAFMLIALPILMITLIPNTDTTKKGDNQK